MLSQGERGATPSAFVAAGALKGASRAGVLVGLSFCWKNSRESSCHWFHGPLSV